MICGTFQSSGVRHGRKASAPSCGPNGQCNEFVKICFRWFKLLSHPRFSEEIRSADTHETWKMQHETCCSCCSFWKNRQSNRMDFTSTTCSTICSTCCCTICGTCFKTCESILWVANRFPKCGFYSFQSAKTHAVAVVCPFLARVPCWLGIVRFKLWLHIWICNLSNCRSSCIGLCNLELSLKLPHLNHLVHDLHLLPTSIPKHIVVWKKKNSETATVIVTLISFTQRLIATRRLYGWYVSFCHMMHLWRSHSWTLFNQMKLSMWVDVSQCASEANLGNFLLLHDFLHGWDLHDLIGVLFSIAPSDQECTYNSYNN